MLIARKTKQMNVQHSREEEEKGSTAPLLDGDARGKEEEKGRGGEAPLVLSAEEQHIAEHGALTAQCVVVSAVAACGGLLFGYDTGVVSGVLLLLEAEFALTAFEQELFVGAAIAACVVGSLVAGCWANDALGRRPTLLWSAVFFAAGAAVLALATVYPVLLVGRVLVGLAVGAASLTSPMYIAETSPPRWRGALVTLNNLALTSGQLLAYALASLFVAAGTSDNDNIDNIDTDALSSSSSLSSLSSALSSSVPLRGGTAWRWLLGLSGVPAAILLGGMLFAPESPRWLLAKGGAAREARARDVLRSLLFGARSTVARDVQDRVIESRVRAIAAAIRAESGTAPPAELHDTPASTHTAAAPESAPDPTVGRSPMLVLAQSLVSCCCPRSRSRRNGKSGKSSSGGKKEGVDDEEEELVREKTEAAEQRRLRAVRRALVVAVGVQMFQQLCGINTAMYYSATIIRTAGFAPTVAIWFSTAVAGANAFSTLVSLFLVDRVGRRRLLCASLLGIAPALVLLGLSFDLGEHGLLPQRVCGLLAVAALVWYTLCFGVGMGPVPWTIISEIFPMHLRAAGNGVATTANWLTNLLVSLTFLSLMEALSKAVVFWLFALVCVVALAFVLFCVPETRRKSLEEIQQELER